MEPRFRGTVRGLSVSSTASATRDSQCRAAERLVSLVRLLGAGTPWMSVALRSCPFPPFTPYLHVAASSLGAASAQEQPLGLAKTESRTDGTEGTDGNGAGRGRDQCAARAWTAVWSRMPRMQTRICANPAVVSPADALRAARTSYFLLPGTEGWRSRSRPGAPISTRAISSEGRSTK